MEVVGSIDDLIKLRNLNLTEGITRRYARKESVLVLAAHPDDEVLGCGGVITRHVTQDDEVHVAIFSMGIDSRYTEEDLGRTEKVKMMQSIREAHEILGLRNAPIIRFHPDQQFDTIPILSITKDIEALLQEFEPNIVYTHFIGDVNEDHQILAKATITACRPKPECMVDKLLFYEVPSSTDWMVASTFVPTYFVDITGACLEKKLSALEKYENEMRVFPHPRSLDHIENLAKVRGASVGLCRAEAFMLGRQIVWG